MKITLADLKLLSDVEIINERLFKSIKGISIDSRKIKEGELFFAIRGENYDGHNFVDEVIAKGCAGVVIDRTQLEKFKQKNYPLIVVNNTIKALGELARIYRDKYKVKVIGITGSNGKTTTKEMIASILSTKFNLLKTEGNLNNNIGLPLNIFRLNNKHEIAVLEMGINHFGEMKELCEIAAPNFGLITNVANAHIEFLVNREGVAKEKGYLFRYLAQNNGFGFVNGDDELIKKQSSVLKRKLIFGFHSRADVKGKIISLNKLAQPTLMITYKGKSAEINLPTFGIHTAQNALCAISVGLKFGISLKRIKQALESFQSYDKRMQLIETKKYTLINDAYNANPDSMKMAIETLKMMNGFNDKVAVLGDMLEIGSESEKFHRELAVYLKDAGIKKAFFFGELTQVSHEEAKKSGINSHHFDDKRKLAEKILKEIPEGSLILLKGSRKMKMEEIMDYLKD